jgi:MFS family permease
VVGWQLYELTGSKLALGLVGLVQAVPAIGLALFAGHMVDRADPLGVYRWVLRLSALAALMLLAVSGSGFGLSLHARVAWIYAASFVCGVGNGFSMPARGAVVGRLMAREDYHESSAWTVSAIHLATVIGPAVGGAIFAWQGARAPHGVDFFLLVAAMLVIAPMNVRAAQGEPRREGPIDAALAGLRYVLSHKLLLPALSLDMFALLFGGVTALLPVYAKDILRVGPVGLGFLRAAPAVGALIASGWLIKRPIRRHAGPILLVVVAGFGATILGFAVSTSFWLSAALLFLGGALDSVSMVIRSVMVQMYSPDDMRGRISAANSIFISVSNELGTFESGVAAQLLGTVPSVIAGGVVTLITVLAVTIWSGELRGMQLTAD